MLRGICQRPFACSPGVRIIARTLPPVAIYCLVIRLGEPMRYVFAALLFAVTWLLWSGIYTPLLSALGILSCGLALWLAKRTGFFESDVYSLNLSTRLPAYWWWLGGEIVRANVAVARIVLKRRMPISPTLAVVHAVHLTPVGQAILANAITLTPATVSYDVSGGVIRVHCLTEASAAELREGEMVRRATRLVGS